MELNEFFTWEYLATFAGCMAATGLVTQMVKGALDKVVSIPTQLLAWMAAVVILELAQLFTGTLTVSTGVLGLLNGIAVAAATSGTISGVKRLARGREAAKTAQERYVDFLQQQAAEQVAKR